MFVAPFSVIHPITLKYNMKLDADTCNVNIYMEVSEGEPRVNISVFYKSLVAYS